MNLNKKIKNVLLTSLVKESFNEIDHLNNALILLSKWRSGVTPWIFMQASKNN